MTLGEFLKPLVPGFKLFALTSYEQAGRPAASKAAHAGFAVTPSPRDAAVRGVKLHRSPYLSHQGFCFDASFLHEGKAASGCLPFIVNKQSPLTTIWHRIKIDVSFATIFNRFETVLSSPKRDRGPAASPSFI